MDRLSRRRRQLLLYLGLGIAGAGVTTSCGAGSDGKTDGKTVGSATSAPTAPSSPDVATSTATLPPVGEALPEFQGIVQWLNSEPLSIAALKQNVVLVQFWTFACINCQRTLPYIVKWHNTYAAQGLRIIGVHTPEFAFERDANNVKQALQKYKITYPVPMDNEFKTWSAYRNEYWPHLFLADRQGFLRYDRIGEGAYDTTEQTIRQLLG